MTDTEYARKLDELDSSIHAANTALVDIKSASDFTQTVVAAQNDDRKAFDQLEKLANNMMLRRICYDADQASFFLGWKEILKKCADCAGGKVQSMEKGSIGVENPHWCLVLRALFNKSNYHAHELFSLLLPTVRHVHLLPSFCNRSDLDRMIDRVFYLLSQLL